MKFNLDWISMVNLFGTANGLFFALIFFRIKRGNKKANRILAFLFINLALISTGAFLSDTNLYRVYPYLMKLGSPCFFAMGPLLFLYVRYLVISNKRSGLKIYLHSLPLIMNYLYNIPFYFMSGSEKIQLSLDSPDLEIMIFRILYLIHFTFYGYLIIKDLNIYHKTLQDGYSTIKHRQLNWIKYLGFAILSVLIVNFISIGNIFFASKMFNIWEAVVIIVLAFNGFTHPVIFGDQEFIKQLIRSEKPVISAERQKKYLIKIIHHVEENRVYLDSQLTMKKFSEDLGMPVSYCSNVINNCLKKSFFDFINYYRIKEAKKRMTDKKKESILDIAFNAGFNSKSSFNSVFKKFVKKTPSQFRNESINNKKV